MVRKKKTGSPGASRKGRVYSLQISEKQKGAYAWAGKGKKRVARQKRRGPLSSKKKKIFFSVSGGRASPSVQERGVFRTVQNTLRARAMRSNQKMKDRVHPLSRRKVTKGKDNGDRLGEKKEGGW